MIDLPIRITSLYLLPLLMLGLASGVACSSTAQEGPDPPEASAGAHLEQATLDAAPPDAFDSKYAELRARGKSHKAATELAEIYAAKATNNATPGGTHHTLEAAVILAKFSATDPQEAKQREQAAEELTMRFESGDLDVGRAVNLLSTITPDASTEDRTQVAGNLARLSSADDLDDRATMEAGAQLTGLIAGSATDANRRINAANELAKRSREGELDHDRALELMSDIAPGLSSDAINESVVDLAGEAVKQSNNDAYDSADVDAATEMLKQTFRGDLDAEGVSDLLGLEQ